MQYIHISIYIFIYRIQTTRAKNRLQATRENTKKIVSDLVDTAIPRIMSNRNIMHLIKKEESNHENHHRLLKQLYKAVQENKRIMSQSFATINKNMHLMNQKINQMQFLHGANTTSNNSSDIFQVNGNSRKRRRRNVNYNL